MKLLPDCRCNGSTAKEQPRCHSAPARVNRCDRNLIPETRIRRMGIHRYGGCLISTSDDRLHYSYHTTPSGIPQTTSREQTSSSRLIPLLREAQLSGEEAPFWTI